MTIIPAARRITTDVLRPNTPIKIISKMSPSEVDRQIHGDKTAGLVRLHNIDFDSPDVIPVDGFVVPTNIDPVVGRVHIFDAFNALTMDVTEKAVLMARGSKFQEESGETETLFTLFDPARMRTSLDAFYKAILSILNPQNNTAVIGQFMVGTLENNPKKIRRKSFSFDFNERMFELSFITAKLKEIAASYPGDEVGFGISCETVLVQTRAIQIEIDRDNLEKTAQEILDKIKDKEAGWIPEEALPDLRATHFYIETPEYYEDVNTIGFENTTFYTFAPDPDSPKNILVDFIKGLGFQTLSKRGNTFALSLDGKTLDLVDYLIHLNPEENSIRSGFRQNRHLYFEITGAGLKLKEDTISGKFPIHIIDTMERADISPPIPFIMSLQEMERLGTVAREVHQQQEAPILTEGTELDKKVYLYQLEQTSIDPKIPLELSSNEGRLHLASRKTLGIWNGRINLLLCLSNLNEKITGLTPFLEILKRDYSDLPLGFYSDLAFGCKLGERAQGDEFILEHYNLSLFATNRTYSPGDHVTSRIRKWIKEGRPITFMQGIRFPEYFEEDALQKADRIIMQQEGLVTAFVVRDVLVESDGSKSQILF
ncbi:MAG: hypothetical protein HQ564_10550 [Candidatus Saganbacteria bacterium]|nr:hypothetical protein [Candidatus Saganbacteria bacterium]